MPAPSTPPDSPTPPNPADPPGAPDTPDTPHSAKRPTPAAASTPGAGPTSTPAPQPSSRPGLLAAIKTRIFSGLLLVLPIAITAIIVYWIIDKLLTMLLMPIGRLISGQQEAWWYVRVIAPILACLVVLALLYLAGLFIGSRLRHLIDWLFLKIPLVAPIYKAVSNVFATLEKQRAAKQQFQGSVLVEFPHPGAKVPGFVTARCEDATTGRALLCIYVPTTPVPTSGFMMIVPEESVTWIDWDLNDTLQAVVSGGMTVPAQVHYFASSERNRPLPAPAPPSS